MFDLWGTRKQRRIEEIRYAILDGHSHALQIVMGAMIDLMTKDNREILIEVIKAQVGKGFTSNAPRLDEETNQIYNDWLSLTLQLFIEGKTVRNQRRGR
jgi:hypothetical protein